MKIQELQRGLLEWFWTEPNELKSFSQIENICSKIYLQFFSDVNSSIAKYKIFYPLLRKGIIEFYGENKFGLSPSCLFSRKDFIAAINYNENSFLKDLEIVYTNNGINVFKKHSTKIFSSKDCNDFSLNNYLTKISPLKSIIDSWDDDVNINSQGYVLFGKNATWIDANMQQVKYGVYKKSMEVYSQRIVNISNNMWKLIPPRKNNIDAFNIAVLWSFIQNDWDLNINYIAKEKNLIIGNIYFPLVIERLLTINTLVESGKTSMIEKRFYHLNDRDFKVLNNLLGNKINIK